MNFKYFIYLSFSILFCSCEVFLKQQATKNFKNSITKTDYYKSLNKHQQDFVYLKSTCENYFPKIDSYFQKNERLELERTIINVLQNTNLTDEAFHLYLTKYASRFNSQHNWISSVNTTSPETYPFYLRHQDSCWYIINITAKYPSSLIGQKIMAFNDVPINEYEKEFFAFVSQENLPSKRKAIQFLWRNPALYEFINNQKMDSVTITWQSGECNWFKKVVNKNLVWQLKYTDYKDHPITNNKHRNFDYQLIDSLKTTYFQFHQCYDKIEIKEGMKTYVKPWLHPLATVFINHQLKKKKPSNLLKNYYDPERPVFAMYISQMIEESNQKGIDKLIIDLRNNNGGSELICLQLLYHLTEKENLLDFKTFVKNEKIYNYYFNTNHKVAKRYAKPDSLYFIGNSNSTNTLLDKITDEKSPYYVAPNRPVFKGKIIVLANYTTESAGALFTALLQDNGIAQVIGTEVANNPTGPSAWTPLKLPNSKIKFSVSSLYLMRPDSSKGPIFIPNITLEKSVSDIIEGNDPLFDKALELLNK